MLRIRLFGGLEVRLGEGAALPLPSSKRARLLLAWLALHAGAQPRGRIAAFFWPEVLDSSARASLRSALWELRDALGEGAAAIEADRERVGLGDGAWVDVREFRDDIAAGRWEEAVELYRGELLPEADEEWVLSARDRERERLGEALGALTVAVEERDGPAEALPWARRCAELDPLAEEPQRELIRLLAACGEPAAALRAFEALRERLREELGLAPSAATRELVEGIRRGGGEPAASGVSLPPPPRLQRPDRGAFVGREAKLAEARSRWRAVAAGERRPELLLLTGEPGIGKTRLGSELADEARKAGAVVLQGSADFEALIPHKAFAEAIGHLVANLDPELLREMLGRRATDLARLVPELELALPELAGGGADAEPRRYMAFEAAAELLAAVSRRAPLLLLLDDLQWADKSTAALLRHLLESRPRARLAIVATYREEELPAQHPLLEVLRELGNRGLVARIALGGMRREEVAEMIGDLAGVAPLPATATAVHVESGGNPFFVREVAMRMREQGAGSAVSAAFRAGLPATARDAIEVRLAHLGETCRVLLAAAAVLGREFDVDLLAAVRETDPDEVAALLGEAADRGLLREEPAPRERFSFAHALVRRALADGIAGAERRRLHARAASAIERLRPGDAEATAEIAHHLCEAGAAGDPERALSYATRAADQAAFRFAHADAVDLYSRCMALLPAGDARRRKLKLKRAVLYQALTHDTYDAGAQVTLRA